MSSKSRVRASAAATALLCGMAAAAASAADCPAYLDRELPRLRSSATINICEAHAGQPLLIVNTASHCGYTPQFSGLQALHEKYRDRGLVVIGFPSNSFRQEARDEAETAEICYINYGVKFTMLAESPVTGPEANPVFRELSRQAGAPKWNFNKYLVSPDGTVVRRFESGVTPDSGEMAAAIEALLAENAPGP